MKVMHLLPSLSSGGVEQVVLELCEGLCSRGIENVVVSAGGSMVPAIEATGARHITRPIGRKSLFTLLQVGKTARLIRAEKPDVLHVHSRVPAWVGQLACRRIPAVERPVIVSSFHGFHSVNAYSAIMAKGDKVIAVSECMRQHILDNYDILTIMEKNQLWKLVMKKVIVYRSQDDELSIQLYPNLPK